MDAMIGIVAVLSLGNIALSAITLAKSGRSNGEKVDTTNLEGSVHDMKISLTNGQGTIVQQITSLTSPTVKTVGF